MKMADSFILSFTHSHFFRDVSGLILKVEHQWKVERQWTSVCIIWDFMHDH